MTDTRGEKYWAITFFHQCCRSISGVERRKGLRKDDARTDAKHWKPGTDKPGTVTWPHCRSVPRSGACLAGENRQRCGSEVLWPLVVDGGGYCNVAPERHTRTSFHLGNTGLPDRNTI